MRIQLTRSRSPLLPGHQRITGLVRYSAGRWAEKLWFDLPPSLAEHPAPGDGWLVALLPLAFQLGERLEIESPVDPQLLRNCEAAQELWSRWFPGQRPVEILAETRPASAEAPPSRTALFFSSGVDSFYTLFDFDQRARTEGRPLIDDLVHVWGYDLPLSRRAEFDRRLARFEAVAADTGKRLLTIATNLRHTRLDMVSWPLVMHGPALAAPLLMLGSPPGQALISANGPRPDLEPYGTHPLGDPLMSSSRLRFVHYGIGPSRLEKTVRISASPLAREHLHVCWKGESDRNCGRCLKCCLTQIALELVDRRLATPTFDPGKFSLQVIHRMRPNSPGGFQYMEELRLEAERIGRRDIAEATGIFRDFNAGGMGAPPLPWWQRTGLKWRNSLRKRQSTLTRLVRQWQS